MKRGGRARENEGVPDYEHIQEIGRGQVCWTARSFYSWLRELELVSYLQASCRV